MKTYYLSGSRYYIYLYKKYLRILMKALYSFFLAFVLFLIAIACKRDEVVSQQFVDITATPCKLISYNADSYTLQYGADNKLEQLSIAEYVFGGNGAPNYRPLWQFQYENGYLRRILRKVKDYPYAAGEEAYTKIKFDYGPRGIEKIYFYTAGYVDYRLDYTYDNFNKPASMIRYVYASDDPSQYPHGDRTPKAEFKYEYDYDKNGNVIKEYRTCLIPNQQHLNYVATFNYDSLDNSIKLLETFVLTSGSSPWIFSTNNLVDGEYLYLKNNSPVPVRIAKTQFDSKNNIISTNWALDVKWDCN